MNKNVDNKTILKQNLKNILQEYNNCIVDNLDKVYVDLNYNIIPNNGNKYYLYIIKNVMYFFKNDSTLTDFYISLDCKIKFSEMLIEGYFYNNNTVFLMYDILFLNSKIVTCEYKDRYNMITSIFFENEKKFVNDSFNFGIHSTFVNNSQNIKLFLNNFKYKTELNCFEYIKGMQKTQNIYKKYDCACNKIITKTNYTEVYNVYNIKTKNKDGVLYVKNITQSKKLKDMFKNTNDDYIIMQCVYNTDFNKWTLN